jgi:L-threonylcarbamoyladenylate synthase
VSTLPLQPAIFLDRDGTLIEDRGYLRSPSEVVFHEDTLSALEKLKGRFLLFIITNQSGIGLGRVTPGEVEEVNRAVVSRLAQAGVTISAVYTCPHTREQGCDCFKPKPFFLEKAASDFRIDLSRSFAVGDHPHDAEMGRGLGVEGVVLLTGHGQKHLHELKDRGKVFVARNLGEAVTWILRRDSQRDNLHRAAEILRRGGIVAFPTETVYGLGADAFQPLAVARIFEAKKRPYFDPLIVHVGRPDDLEKLVTGVPPAAAKLIDRFWPGPLTIVLEKRERVPEIVTAGLPTVAVRMPNHPLASCLLEEANCPIAAPSANLFGNLSPTTAEHVREQLGDQVDLVLDGGPCKVGVESTILSLAGDMPRLLRPGGLALEEIESIIGPVRVGTTHDEKPLAPGRLERHYAPRTPLVISDDRTSAAACTGKRVGRLAFSEDEHAPGVQQIEVLSKTGDLREAAANLFSAIRKLDRLNLDLIVADPVPEIGLGRAIMDRLRRASLRPEGRKQ